MTKFFILLILLFNGAPLFGSKIMYQSFSDRELEILSSAFKGRLPGADIKNILSHPSFKKIPDMISMNVTKPIRLKTSMYAHFAEEPALTRARKFSSRWQRALKEASQKYRVDPEVITSIILIETNLGTYTGKYRLMSVYPSVFVDSVNLLKNGSASLSKRMLKRVKRKKAWALNQLRSLLKMYQSFGMDLFNIRGSYAGAMGICQFLPSSYLRYAVSAIPGSKADLFTEPDAIHSVASYLKNHGYRLGLNRSKNRKAIYAYNHSDVYVNIVLKVAKKLKAMENRTH